MYTVTSVIQSPCSLSRHTTAHGIHETELIAGLLLQDASQADTVRLPGVFGHASAELSSPVSAACFMHGGLPPIPATGLCIAALLWRTSLTRMDPELVAMHHCWGNLVRFCHQRGCTLSWADIDLPVVLSLDHPAPQSPSPALWTLLAEPAQPEKPFLGFLTAEPDGFQGAQAPSSTAIPASPFGLLPADQRWSGGVVLMLSCTDGNHCNITCHSSTDVHHCTE